MIDALNESTYPWERILVSNGQPWPLNIKFFENIAATGSRGGMSLPTGNVSYLSGAIDHELGHVLDGRLIPWEARSVFTNRYCDHSPKHGWYTSPSTPYAFAGAENFANGYVSAFHNPEGFGLMGHYAPAADREWFTNWVLGF